MNPLIDLIDFRSNAHAQSMLNESPEAIKAEIQRLDNSVSHLKKSNEALEEALLEDNEMEYIIAIAENKVTIKKKTIIPNR